MGRGPLIFKQSHVERAVKAVSKTGLKVSAIEFSTDGKFRLEVGREQAELKFKTPLDDWKGTRDANKA